MKALLGRKIGMTQLFDENGLVQHVTVIEAGPCVVTQVKTKPTDGYNALQIGFGQAKRLSKPQAGHLKAAKAESEHTMEVRLPDLPQAAPESETEAEVKDTEIKVGQTLNVADFEVGDIVQVRGTSKGKGFAGTIKRHNFHRGPKTHGSHNYRAPGSIGSMYPQRVFPGIKMAGRMGGDRVTVKNLPVVLVDSQRNLLAVRGAVPGSRRSLVLVKGQNG